MAFLEQVIRGRTPRPPRLMVYGTHGIGKSSLGASAPKHIFIQTEEGLDEIDCARFPLAQSVGDVFGAIGELYQAHEHPFTGGVVVLDTADWFERLAWQAVCQAHTVKNIEEIGYAKGYSFALTHWRDLLSGLDALRDKHNMAVLLLAHAKVETFQNPEGENYDRYTPRLHKLAAAMVQEWCDAVLFAQYRVYTKTEKGAGFGQKKAKAIGAGERILRTVERPYALAKNRYSLPEELPFPQGEAWSVLQAAIAGRYTAPAEETHEEGGEQQ